MIDRKAIFNRAWEIKKSDNRNIFSLCLKMAWEETKAMKNETFEEKVERLSRKYSRWTKTSSNGKTYDRIYFNATALGLQYQKYNTGNIRCAWIDGYEGRVSNCAANRMLNEKAYLDLTTGKLYIDRTIESYFGDKIREEIS